MTGEETDHEGREEALHEDAEARVPETRLLRHLPEAAAARVVGEPVEEEAGEEAEPELGGEADHERRGRPRDAERDAERSLRVDVDAPAAQDHPRERHHGARDDTAPHRPLRPAG